MTAIILTGKPPGGERVILADVLPLSTPLVVQIFPIYRCNQTCPFCHFSIPPDQRGFITDKVTMDWAMFANLINGMSKFPAPVRVLRFVGMGEPLLHPHISKMVRYAKLNRVADKVEIVTNGTLLDQDMAYRLAVSGLDRLVVSVQDTSLVEKIRYFHSFERCHVYVKIIDCCLKEPEDEQMFYDAYRNACDSMAVEYAGPIYRGVEWNKELCGTPLTQYGVPPCDVKICSQPFTSVQVNPDGNVVPCYSIEYPVIIGNVYEESIVDIWNGEKMKKFRLKMLDGRVNASEACSQCEIIKHRMFKEDNLNDHAERLKEVYG